MDILNKTKRPLSVPLPGGKKLHLGPGRTGQIRPDALEHPPLKELVDSGDVEVVGGGRGGKGGGDGRRKRGSIGQGHKPPGGIRHHGDG